MDKLLMREYFEFWYSQHFDGHPADYLDAVNDDYVNEGAQTLWLGFCAGVAISDAHGKTLVDLQIREAANVR